MMNNSMGGPGPVGGASAGQLSQMPGPRHGQMQGQMGMNPMGMGRMPMGPDQVGNTGVLTPGLNLNVLSLNPL